MLLLLFRTVLQQVFCVLGYVRLNTGGKINFGTYTVLF